MLKHCAIFLVAALLAGAVHAELKGSYQLQKDRQVDLFYRDDQHIRASVDDDKQLIVKEGETWVLKRQEEKWLALNAEGVGGLLRAVTKDRAEEIGPVQLRPLGRKETVAGYPGEVYELSSGDKKIEIVLSDNPDVLALTNAWRLMAQKIGQNLGQKEALRLRQALDTIPRKGKGGLLRQGDNFVLVAIDKKVKSSDVDFPPDTQVVQLPQLSLPGMR